LASTCTRPGSNPSERPLKRAHKGVYHKFSKKHLHRYVADFVGRHDLRNYDTMEQMRLVAQGMTGKRLRYKDLIA